jgi:hypothetical protein
MSLEKICRSYFKIILACSSIWMLIQNFRIVLVIFLGVFSSVCTKRRLVIEKMLLSLGENLMYLS